MPRFLPETLAEFRAIFSTRPVWMALAREDIGDQHRRTWLGPLWLLVNYLIFAGTFIYVFQGAGAKAGNYTAYVCLGLLTWFYMTEAITLSVSLFVREESFIKGTKLPLTTYVMRLGMQSVIRSGYALAGCLAILWLNGVTPSPAWAWSGLGVLLILWVTPAAITVFAFLGAFFPDSQFIVANLMRIGLFLTPVLWTPETATGIRHLFYYWDPFTYFLEIVRVPILAGSVPIHAFVVCLVTGLALWLVALLLLGRYRRHIVFVI
ncbi:ABC transporter permease [Frateuria edaphi]|uniref:ABC transporter permease n=1 Tax=Frateuria edaphi TaxID=2898793 RepID=UPI001E2ABEC2|nr:ABC transporter permease [Frateuria edaphi]UGB44996.1 ABC transporter permease [Frateuria edaphi]